MKKTISSRSLKADQGKVALLVIDVQQGLFEKSTPIYKVDELLQNINSLVERAHRSNVPIFYVQHSDPKNLMKGTPGWQLHSRLQPCAADCIINKQHGNAFEETDLEEVLQSKNVTSLVITGLVTHGCVKATCTGALQLGYRVILAEDGHSSFSKQAAKLIEEWNQKLSVNGAELRATSEIDFQ